MSHLLLSVMGAFAQFERDLIRERPARGHRSGKAAGGCLCRPQAFTQSGAGQRTVSAGRPGGVEDQAG